MARACIKGVIIVIVLYMLLNAALVNSVGLTALAGSDLALARALELATSPAAGSVVVVAAILMYFLLALHIGGEIYYGLRWLA